MSKSICILAGALLTLAFSLAEVRADSVPWGYSAGNTEIFNSNNGDKTSSIQFAGASGVATGSSGIIIYNATTSSGVAESTPDSFSNVPFNIAFTLTDINATGSSLASAKSSEVVQFSGTFSATNVTNKSLLPGLTNWTSPVVAEVMLGADDVGWNKYSVTLASFTSPGQPGGSPGSIQAIVTIDPALPGGGIEEPPPPPNGEGDPPTAATPEPASGILAGLGAVAIVAAWRKRRRS